MGSRKRSAQVREIEAFKAQLGGAGGTGGAGGGLDDLFAREEERQRRDDEEHDRALRHKACESKNRYATRAEAEDAIAQAKRTLDGSDVDAIKAAGEKLQDVAYKLAQIVYSDAQSDGGYSADDDVVDADYEVVDDED